MKKQLIVAFGLAVLATPAFATKARMEALGEDNFGSYYINDNRNQFLNPAKINDQKDLVTYEFGSSSTGGAVTADAPATPKAEAGFNKAWNNMVYGLHFGNTTPTVSALRTALPNVTTLQERNPWDLFVGGDAGVKWGANLTYENTQVGSAATSDRITSHGLRSRVGVVAGDLEAFAHYSFQGTANNYKGDMIDGKGGYFLGAGYMMNAYKFFADYRHAAVEYSNSTNTKKDFTRDTLRLGVGRQERLNDKATLFAKVNIENQTDKDTGTGAVGAKAKNSYYVLPLNVGLEYDAASWLVLRTSVGQNVWSSNTYNPSVGKTSHTNLINTSVRAGATLKFGEFAIDGLISTGTATDTTGATATTNAGNGQLRTDGLMSRVSMTYRF